MVLNRFFTISPPSGKTVPPESVPGEYRRLRRRTFWGVTVAYSLYYVCRMALSVVKQPLIDDGILSAGELGLISSAVMFVYAVGKFMNGFIADYCNIRRFMATGLLISALINLVLGVLGWVGGSSTALIFIVFAVLWGVNGWAQSMGAPPGVISLSRWFPLAERGTWYSIFSSTPYIGKSLTMIVVGALIGVLGWESGFLLAAVCGLIGAAIVVIFVSDTPESRGLPSIQDLSGEKKTEVDTLPTRQLHRWVLKNPGIWVIALSSAFIYITQYAVSNWGVLFLQKSKGFSIESGATVIGLSEAFGIAGTILAGWLSDKVFKGNRARPVIISGLVCFLSLGLFLFTKGGAVLNTLYVSLYSLSIGVVYCIVAGLMALDIVPRKATGAALGIVGISSYVAAGIQDIASGFIIQGSAAAGSADFDFTAVSLFWLSACLISFILPVIGWKHLAGGRPSDFSGRSSGKETKESDN